MQSKQKITLYIPPELHRKLKIKAAVDVESMSALVEKAISFYMQFPDKVDEAKSSANGRTHQIHLCPECDTPLVMREGELAPVVSQEEVIKDDIHIGISSKVGDEVRPNEEELVSCI